MSIFSSDATRNRALGRQSSRHNRAGESFVGLAEAVEFEPVSSLNHSEFIAQGDEIAVLLFERFRIKLTGIFVNNNYVHIVGMQDSRVVQSLSSKTKTLLR
jgi:hypothetical protein